VTDHDHADLIARLTVAPWHHSPGYNRKDDGTRVGKHSYLLGKDGRAVQALITTMIDLINSNDPCVWRGQYQGRGHVYRYLTLPDGWTYWHMGGQHLINRDQIVRAEREYVPRRAAQSPPLFDGT